MISDVNPLVLQLPLAFVIVTGYVPLIEKSDPETSIDKYPHQLSGGQRQRVAVARALVNKPSIILADEPTGNLDNKNAESLYEMFLQLKQTYGQQIIMVTHNESLTKQSDQVIYLNSGVIQ